MIALFLAAALAVEPDAAYEAATDAIAAQRYQAAIEALLPLVDEDPDELAAWLLLAKSYNRLGLYAEARAALSTAEMGGMSGPVLDRERGIALAGAGFVDEALPLLEADASGDPVAAWWRAALHARAFAPRESVRTDLDLAAADPWLANDIAATRAEVERWTYPLDSAGLDGFARAGASGMFNAPLAPDPAIFGDPLDFALTVDAEGRLPLEAVGGAVLFGAGHEQPVLQPFLRRSRVMGGLFIDGQTEALAWIARPVLDLFITGEGLTMTSVVAPLDVVKPRPEGAPLAADYRVRAMFHHGGFRLDNQRYTGIYLHAAHGLDFERLSPRLITAANLSTGGDRRYVAMGLSTPYRFPVSERAELELSADVRELFFLGADSGGQDLRRFDTRITGGAKLTLETRQNEAIEANLSLTHQISSGPLFRYSNVVLQGAYVARF